MSSNPRSIFLSPRSFVHLRTHSDYSLGHSSVSVQKLATTAKDLKLPAIALTDRNNMFGALEFATFAVQAGIQPISGLLISVEYGIALGISNSPMYGDILLLAKSLVGYQNLLYIVSSLYINLPFGLDLANHSAAHRYIQDSMSGKLKKAQPALSLNFVLSHLSDVIVLIGAQGSPLSHLLLNDDFDASLKLYDLLAHHAELYIELARYPSNEHKSLEQLLMTLVIQRQAICVATNPVQFISNKTYEATEALHCILNGLYFDDKARERINPNHYIKTYDEMMHLFADIPEAVENTCKIARKCLFIPKAQDAVFPKFLDTKEDEKIMLAQKAHDSLQKKLEYIVEEKHEEYRQRLDYELRIINQTGFAGYFLVVADFICWAKEQGIAVGCGRGSGVGSIVAWLIKITDIDPLIYGLLFERFLNPERISLPDFDIDFCQTRRGEVIEYVRLRYGYDKVAHICAIGKIQARAAVRDCGRILQLGYNYVNNICKRIPNNPAHPIRLPEAIELDKELQQMSADDPSLARLLDIALTIEGSIRNISTHAAGVVISATPLYESLPLYQELNSNLGDMPISQFSMKYVEMAGMLKFDFLGLKTLTVLSEACKLIYENHGIELDLTMLPLDNDKTFEILSRGLAIGVFQFDGAGMRDVLRSMRPTHIADLIALGALYRPGPMENIPQYINRKHGVEQIEYIHPALEELLKETYGIIIYQEQVMKIAQILADYTLGEADLLRKAMGKKDHTEMTKQRNIFISRCVQKQLPKEKAAEIFDFLAKFASYGFNKSHATGYGMISYQTAYVKANFAIEFFVTSMNLDIEHTEKVHIFRMDAKHFDIAVLPPSINSSKDLFGIETINGKQYIRFGLAGIKGIGQKIAKAIIDEREANGAFQNIQDLMRRMKKHDINKKTLDSLAKSGALREIYENTAEIIENAEYLLQLALSDIENSGQLSLLFGCDESSASEKKNAIDILPVQTSFWSKAQSLRAEYEVLEMYIASNPLDSYTFLIDKLKIYTSLDLDILRMHLQTSRIVKMMGILTAKSIRSNKSENARKFAFIQITDLHGIVDLSIFDEEIIYQNARLLEEGTILVMDVNIKRDIDGGTRILVEKIYDIEDIASRNPISQKIMLHDMRSAILLNCLIKYYQECKNNAAFTISDEFIDELYDLDARLHLSRNEISEILSLVLGAESLLPLAQLNLFCKIDNLIVEFETLKQAHLPTSYLEVLLCASKNVEII